TFQDVHKISHLTEGKGEFTRILMADYGPVWKEPRCFALMSLRNVGLGKMSMENRILGGLNTLNHLESLRICFRDAELNILYLVLFGSHFDYDDEIVKEYSMLFNENTKLLKGPWAMVRRYIIA
ncbi:hypothetical protein QTP70_031027, partial [Hemibagrus guttatus]